MTILGYLARRWWRPRFLAFEVPLAALALLAWFWPSPAQELTGRVVYVFDGDTIAVTGRGKQVRVRVFGIDCPEKGQPWADQATAFTARLTLDRQVTIQVRDVDKYHRLVGRVFLPDGRDLSRELIAAGLAWHYRHYSDDPDLARLEAEARNARRGLWRDPAPVAPWDYKHQQR